jgi:molybdopterin converting factor small subunit
VSTLTTHMARKAGLKRQSYLGKYKVGGGDLAILVNGRNIALLDGVKTALWDGDEVVLLPPTAGG